MRPAAWESCPLHCIQRLLTPGDSNDGRARELVISTTPSSSVHRPVCGSVAHALAHQLKSITDSFAFSAVRDPCIVSSIPLHVRAALPCLSQLSRDCEATGHALCRTRDSLLFPMQMKPLSAPNLRFETLNTQKNSPSWDCIVLRRRRVAGGFSVQNVVYVVPFGAANGLNELFCFLPWGLLCSPCHFHPWVSVGGGEPTAVGGEPRAVGRESTAVGV